MNMKKLKIFKYTAIVLLLAGSFISCEKKGEIPVSCDCMDEYYYRSHDGNVILDDKILNDCLLVGFDPQVESEEIVKYINQTGLFKLVNISQVSNYKDSDRYMSEYFYNLLLVSTRSKKSCAQLKEIIRTLESSHIVAYAGLTFNWGGEDKTIWADGYFFYVKVIDKSDLSDLYALVQETNTLIVDQFEFDDSLFTLRANKNSKYGSAIKMSNYFYETGRFASAGPDLLLVKGSIY